MLAGITIKEARDMGYSIRNAVLDQTQAKILQHYSRGCKGRRTVCVVYDMRGNGAIIAGIASKAAGPSVQRACGQSSNCVSSGF